MKQVSRLEIVSFEIYGQMFFVHVAVLHDGILVSSEKHCLRYDGRGKGHRGLQSSFV